MVRVPSRISRVPLYRPPLGGRSGVRLDFNENTAGCSPRVLERLKSLTGEEIARYPEREPVEGAVAKFLGIDAGELLLTNGVDEAIHLLCEAFLEPGDEVLIVVPTFSMYQISAAATGARVVEVPAGAEFRFPAREVLARITPDTRLIAIANPNNPTGASASPADLLQIACSAPHAAVLVDEAYFEFCGDTLLREWRTLPNLFVARTFSKAHGLAALRIGALAGNSESVSAIRRIASPYNVNGVALALLPAAIADEEYVRDYVEQVCCGRARLEAALGESGIQYWPSRANFVLARFGPSKDDFIRGMRERHILVRDRSNDYGCAGCVRITLGTVDHTEQLLTAFREVLQEMEARAARA